MELIKNLVLSGLSLIPCNNKKEPILKTWLEFKERLPTIQEAERINPPFGIICGKISGGLCCLDFDDSGSRFNPWYDMVVEINPYFDFTKMLIQKTPSGGRHVIYRCLEAGLRNIKLAEKKEPDEEGKITLIETRGEGGYFVASPSFVYHRGKLVQYELQTPIDFLNIPTISLQDHELLISCARSFNEKIEIKKETVINSGDFIESPLDDYNSKTNPIPLLESHGWTVTRQHGEKLCLRRPGKTEGSISATWNHFPGLFHVFSSNTEFENKSYSAAGVYTVLEHKGDYSASSKALLKLGYGKKKEYKEVLKKERDFIEPRVFNKVLTYYTANDFRDEIEYLRKNGVPLGVSTGFTCLDSKYMVAKGWLNVVTGIPSHGKSEVMDAIMINISRVEKWNFIVFSPENFPLSYHFQKLAEKYEGQQFSLMTPEQVNKCIQFINDHFIFIPATEEGVNVTNVLSTIDEILKTKKIDGVLLDPWNELEPQSDTEQSETQYIGQSLSTIRKFARKKNLAIWIVAHPTKLKKEKVKKDGGDVWEYPVPDLYTISGSANWYNKADNGIVVYRDFDRKVTKVLVQKIKSKHYGSIGEAELVYEIKTGRFRGAEDGDDF